MKGTGKTVKILISVYLSANMIVNTALVMLQTNVNVMIALLETSLTNALNNVQWVVQTEDAILEDLVNVTKATSLILVNPFVKPSAIIHAH